MKPTPGFPALLISSCLVAVLLLPFALGAASSTERRVAELLSRMSLEEKIGQMTQVDMNAVKDKEHIARYAFGSMLSGGDSDPADITPEGWRRSCHEFQSWALKSRLRIPLIYGIDAVHGHNNVDGAVVFPQNIGLGATRNASLVRDASRITAREIAATSMHWAFGPCVAVARDARWGRTYESFGESPELVSRLGAAATKGLQSRLPGGYRVLACAKHYLGDGGTERGVDQGNMVCDEDTLRRLHLAPYATAIKAGAGSVMVSYSSWNGVKMHGNKFLLRDVLKGELGFRGFLVSDWAAIDQLSGSYKEAIEKSVNAGLDMAMIPNGPGQKNNYVDYITALKELVAEGRVTQSRIDDAVTRILRTKLEFGLFDRPYGIPQLMEEFGSAAHRKVARQCVRESLVILKNENHILPFSKKLRYVAVLGKGADDLGMQCGGWTVTWQGKNGKVTSGGTTILEGMRRIAPAETRVTYSPDRTNLERPDAILVVVGEQPYAEMKGDRTDLSLSAEDQALVQKAKATGAPVVTLLLSGRPMVLGRALEISDGFIAAWLPGTEGTGVADVLFGHAKPKGKLPRTWPRTNEQLDVTTGDAREKETAFPCGFGLRW